ncbi:MAG: nucleotidyltransferase family protein [Oscillochloris sp.]|nr:nucleotidyltransferase family protein [Oscillochloris sp.]
MIYGILLAAGTSSRMGQPKQLLAWRGRPLVRHVAEQALASRLAGLVVVVGAAADDVRAALAGLEGRLLIVDNPAYAEGQAGSLRAGLSALPTAARAALVLLVDQPLVGPALIDRILAVYAAQPTAAALVPLCQGRRGTPVLLGHELFDQIQGLTGDIGARAVLAAHPGVALISLDDPALLLDLDTPEQYAEMGWGRIGTHPHPIRYRYAPRLRRRRRGGSSR